MTILKGKALRRAVKTADAHRITENIPLIHDKTELITPEIAEKMLRNNKSNRPINWNKVEEYRKAMEEGTWKFHAQGIILDDKGNILTGQKRLWAIIYSGAPQYMRVSRGSPPETANLIDRGTAQSSRDLASRQTERKHSPVEVSIVRAALALQGITKPSTDIIGDRLVKNEAVLKTIMEKTKGIKKTKDLLMVLGVVLHQSRTDMLEELEPLGKSLVEAMKPTSVAACWNRGAAFSLAMEKAQSVVESKRNR